MPKLLKDKRISIWERKWDDSYTELTKYNYGTYWAHFRTMSIRETFQAGIDYAETNVYFTLTKPSNFEISTHAFIEYPVGSGKHWDIVSVDNFEDRDGTNIRVLCRPAAPADVEEW